MKKEKNIIILFLLLSVSIFFISGLYHLSKFETVDEHFWKYERIPQYWTAVKNQDWKKTYVNDKPGITVAFFSGLGLPFSPDPQKHRVRDEIATQSNELTIYDSSKTEKINLAFRLPILIINSLFLLFFFWIIKKATGSERVALFSVMFMSLSPILIGISQIMNPDAFLWTFSAGALFSYIAQLKHKGKKYVFLAGLFTGLSLLSKYTANILFPLYFALIFSNYFFNFQKIEEEEGARKYFSREIASFFAIFLLSVAIFSVFMPSVFIKSKHLYQATIGFPGLKILIAPIFLIFSALALDLSASKGFFIKKIGEFFFKHQEKLSRAVCSVSFFIFVLILINCWTGQKMIPFDTLRAEAYFEKEMTWGGLLDKDFFLLKTAKEFLIEVYPFVFSLTPLSLFLILALWLRMAFGKIKNFKLLIFFLTILPIVYFSATLMSKVLTNPRYSIMLYPMYAFLSGIAMHELGSAVKFSKLKEKNILILSSLTILISGLTAIYSSKPFYFNYTSDLLPKKFIITDAWGYGEYEAAEYLNSLPNPEKLIIWSDRSAICQFIKGSCIRDYKIDLTKVVPNYFVISKRGTIRHQFIWEHPELAKKDSFSYYSDDLVNNPEWSLHIHDRPENFIKIIKSEE